MNYLLWDKVRDWVLLFALLAVSSITLVSRNEPLVRGVRSIALQVAGNVESKLAWVSDYIRALDENDRLRSENIMLSSQVARSREAVIENERLKNLLQLRDTLNFPTLPAKILTKDVHVQENFMTLDVGRRHGVAPGMGVVDESGIIGKVVLVSEKYSRAMPYLNTEFRVPAKIQFTQAAGIVKWDGRDRLHLSMDHVTKTEPVIAGQMVVTSSSSGSFQPGYPIGIVDSVAIRPGRNELSILLRPLAQYTRAEHVFVVLKNYPEEQVEIESRSVE